MQEHRNFWDKNAGRYDRFMRKDRAAYAAELTSPEYVLTLPTAFDSPPEARTTMLRTAAQSSRPAPSNRLNPPL